MVGNNDFKISIYHELPKMTTIDLILEIQIIQVNIMIQSNDSILIKDSALISLLELLYVNISRSHKVHILRNNQSIVGNCIKAQP